MYSFTVDPNMQQIQTQPGKRLQIDTCNTTMLVDKEGNVLIVHGSGEDFILYPDGSINRWLGHNDWADWGLSQ